MDTKIEVITLGQLRIQQNGQVLGDFISTKAVLLFVYLAMHPGEHTRKKLATMFWSETNDQQALKNLRTVLSSIRQNMPDALIALRDGLAINPEVSIQVDANLFERGCVAALSSTDTPRPIREMQDLAALYQGAFLADVSYREAAALDDWIADKQRQFQQLYNRLLYEIVETAEAASNFDTGIQYAIRLVNLDPYWDAAQRQLMRLLAYTNRSNEALRQYEVFARLLEEELDAEPDEETRELYEQIRSRRMRPPQQQVARTSIVLPDMPFVESVDDIGLIQRMLNTPQCHLLTIYGISGIGKTALATQVAYQRQHSYSDGAYVISLKSAQSARDLPFLIAKALGIDLINRTTPHELEGSVLDYLKDRQVLLVLDNYEHLLPETSFLQAILEQASAVQIVITSQVPLNLFREWLFPLQGLRVPLLDVGNAEDYESVRLFELTAQRINPRFNLRENLADVVEICRLVDGLPLALIIAAGWTQIVAISKIKEYIMEGQEFSLPLQQDLPPHHQSLDMMLEYTWSNLTIPEQYALMALSIFNSSFDIDEVEQICRIELDVLTALIQKSLIQKYDDRYRIHQLIWRYARKKLLYSDQRDALAQSYLDYIVRMLCDLQEQKPPLHEYLLTIEVLYSGIWNYDWMARSFQPHYILKLSRYLIAYWEISRSDELPRIQMTFEGIRSEGLSAESRMLLNMQLARFCLHNDQREQAYQHVRLILRENALNTPWADWGAVFNLCMPLFQFMTSEYPRVLADQVDEDLIILSISYLKLLSLYLDMRDYDAADDFFQHLLQSIHQPIDYALILAAQGAIAAENKHFATAFTHFMNALQYLEHVDEPLLRLALHTLVMRTAHILARDDEVCQHLFEALLLAAAAETKAAMVQLLVFCSELPLATGHYELTQYIRETVDNLQAQSPGNERSASRQTLQSIAERVIAMTTGC